MYRSIRILSALILIACGRPDPPQDVPDRAESSPERLLARATDRALTAGHRVSAAEALLRQPGGAGLLAADYAEGNPAVRSLLDSLLAQNPGLGSRLAAAMMAVAQGEAKLDFEALLLMHGEFAAEPLMDLLTPDQDWQTTACALDALGKLKLAAAVDPIAAHLAHPNTWVRIAAAHALGDIGGATVVQPLSSALTDTAHTVVTASLIALGRTGLPQAVTKCARHLAHANPRVRAAAVSALGRLGGPDSGALLEPMRRDPDAGVRYKAERALKRLGASR